jgi:hypothetical protein
MHLIAMVSRVIASVSESGGGFVRAAGVAICVAAICAPAHGGPYADTCHRQMTSEENIFAEPDCVCPGCTGKTMFYDTYAASCEGECTGGQTCEFFDHDPPTVTGQAVPCKPPDPCEGCSLDFDNATQITTSGHCSCVLHC